MNSFPECEDSSSRSNEGQADDLACGNSVMGKMSKVSEKGV